MYYYINCFHRYKFHIKKIYIEIMVTNMVLKMLTAFKSSNYYNHSWIFINCPKKISYYKFFWNIIKNWKKRFNLLREHYTRVKARKLSTIHKYNLLKVGWMTFFKRKPIIVLYMTNRWFTRFSLLTAIQFLNSILRPYYLRISKLNNTKFCKIVKTFSFRGTDKSEW